MKALILSAGLGTRLRPYSALTPKPMFTLADRPLLDLHIRTLEAMNCEAVAVNTHHLSGAIEEFISRQSYSIPVRLNHEPRLLGTGGAIKNLADFWDERPFMVVNADIYHDFDLGLIYQFHCSHPQPATLVFWNDENFNSVLIDSHGMVRSFDGQASQGIAGHCLTRTFTGIQVLDPAVLDFIPPDQPSHSIDAFRGMMKAGYAIKAYLPDKGYWTDLGSPERYRKKAREMTAQAGFAAAYGNAEKRQIRFESLAGDGSERRWYRLKSGERSLIMCDHGLKSHRAAAEVDAFVSIGQHLGKQSLPVPRIFFHDRFAGLVVLQDLGDTHLQTAVRQSADEAQIGNWYQRIIADLIDMSVKGIDGFNPAWTFQSENYDRDLILEKECRYFLDAFLHGYLNLEAEFEQLLPEFEHLAAGALEHALMGFMHRDLQSRNIMVAEDRFYLIDFQAGRRGPLQYDLASLLMDPYVELSEGLQADLLDYAVDLITARCKANPNDFRRSYIYCRLSRNLQILGAFGYLSRVKGKPFFEPYIKPAVNSLHRQLSHLPDSEFGLLRKIVAEHVFPRFNS